MKFNREKFETILEPSENDFFKRVDKLIGTTQEREVNVRIALLLLDYMDKNQLTQKDLALKLCMKPQYTSRLLAGKVNVSVAKACQYGDLLGISLVVIPSCHQADAQIKEHNKSKSNAYSLTFSKCTNQFGEFRPGCDTILLS